MRHVLSWGPSMHMGIPSLPNSRSRTPSRSPGCPAAFAKSACGSNPSPRAYPTAPDTIRWAGTSGTSAGMRNVAVAVCRQLGFGGRAVAEVMGLTENYVATLHNRALREGTAGLVRAAGRPRKLAAGAWEKAARWRAEGASDSEIARRLGVAQSTVFRRLCPAAVQERLPDGGPAAEPVPQADKPEAVPVPPRHEPSSRPAAEPARRGS